MSDSRKSVATAAKEAGERAKAIWEEKLVAATKKAMTALHQMDGTPTVAKATVAINEAVKKTFAQALIEDKELQKAVSKAFTLALEERTAELAKARAFVAPEGKKIKMQAMSEAFGKILAKRERERREAITMAEIEKTLEITRAFAKILAEGAEKKARK